MALPIFLAAAAGTLSFGGGFGAVATGAAIVSYYSNQTAILDAYAAAFETTRTNLTPEQIKWAQDAWRHTYISAKLAQNFGSNNAKVFDLWEYQSLSANESNMDYWNNDVGRQIGTAATSNSDLIQRIVDAIENKDLILDPDPSVDARTYSGTVFTEQDVTSLTAMSLDDAFEDDLNGEDPSNVFASEFGGHDYSDFSEVEVSDVPIWFSNVVDFFGVTVTGTWDPLVIDIDGDGINADYKPHTLNGSQAIYQTHFDLDGDGFAQAVDWHADGFLVRDLNSNGRIDNGNEMFGDVNTDGFTALAAFDGNADGVIDASDAIWSDLQIWEDVNLDGQTQSDELHDLTTFDITGINLAATATGSTLDLTHTGSVNTSTGTLEAGNYNFSMDVANTRYALDYTFDIRSAFVPMLRGYNQMADLHIAISLDNDETDPDSLISLMSDIASNDFTDIFENYASIKSTVEDLLFRWAGVDGVATDSRGDFLDDARKLEFMEEYFGADFVARNFPQPDPGAVQAREIEDLWDNTIVARASSNILMQTAASDLLSAGPSFNFADDIIDGARSLSQSAVDDLEAAASALSTTAEKQEFWVGVTDFLRNLQINRTNGGNEFGLSASEETMLKDAIEASDSSLTWASEDHDPGNGTTSIEYKFFNPDGDTIVGDATANNPLDGGAQADVISGLAGADTIQGNAGNDLIYGHNEDGSGDDNAADTIFGGDGDDHIFGNGGNDTLQGGDGNDHIIGGAGDDTLIDGGIVGAPVVQDQNLLEGEAGDDDYIVAVTSGNSDETFIEDTSGFDQLKFTQGQGSAFDHEYEVDISDFTRLLNDHLRLDIGPDIILIDQLTALNDANGAGVEEVLSYSGGTGTWVDLKSLLLNTTDQIKTIGTEYDDDISGINIGNPDDDIRVFAGNDIVSGDDGDDDIFGGDGDDTLSGGADDDRLYGENGEDDLSGGDGNDELYGGNDADTLDGGDGNDLVFGDGGADILRGGLGTDTVWGSGGNDTYIFVGGTDYYYDGSGDAADKIIVENTNPEDLAFSNTGSSDVQIDVTGTLSGQIVVQGQRLGSSTRIESIEFDDGFNLDFASYSIWRFDAQSGVSSDETVTGYSNVVVNGGTDRVTGSTGTDRISTGAQDDFIYGQGGDDLLHAGSGDDLIEAGLGNDRVWGGSGIDTLSFVSASGAITVDLALGTSYGEGDDTFTGIENVIGSAQIDTITGDDGDNVIAGGAGGDTLDGGLGSDTADYSGNTAAVNVELNNNQTDEGRDSSWDDDLTSIENVIGTNYADRFIGDGEDNTVHAGDGADMAYGGVGSDTLHGDDGNDALYGEHGDDTLYGGAGADTLDGDRYNLSANDSGNDTIYGGAGADNIWGRHGDDVLHGEDGNDIMRGNEGNDTLFGGAGNDKLYGHDGDDILWGGLDHDDLWGGAGADTFAFASTLIFDEIHDFSLTEGDKLDISNIVTGFDPGTSVLTDFFKIGFNGTHSYAHVDSDGGADGFDQIIKFVNTELDETDFTVGVNLII